MSRVLVDSASAAWPASGWDLLAAYINGIDTSHNYADACARFPSRISDIKTITVDGSLTEADICDCENGDYNITSAANWIHWRIQNGVRPTLYANRTTYPAVVASLNSAYNLGAKDFDWWASTLDGTQNVPGAVAVQYFDNGSVDFSIVWEDSWFPSLSKEIMMGTFIGQVPPVGETILIDTGTTVYVLSGAEMQDIVNRNNAAGVHTEVIYNNNLFNAVYTKAQQKPGTTGTFNVTGTLNVTEPT